MPYFQKMIRSIYLTTFDVAKREGLSRAQISEFCRKELIFPSIKHNKSWLIGREYAFVIPKGSKAVLPGKKRPGRPPGAKNKKPYPKGVKRPRKVNLSHIPE